MTIREAIDLIVSHGRSLSEEEAAAIMRDIPSGEVTPARPRRTIASQRRASLCYTARRDA